MAKKQEKKPNGWHEATAKVNLERAREVCAQRRAERDANQLSPEALEKVVVHGDLAVLEPEDRTRYYYNMCDRLGLDRASQPFEMIKFQGKVKLYAKKGCAEQLRRIHRLSVEDLSINSNAKNIIATCIIKGPGGRREMNIGVVKASSDPNELMKAATKALRRATLGWCGLGDIEEAHPGEYTAVDNDDQECRTKVLLEGPSAQISVKNGAEIIREERKGKDEQLQQGNPNGPPDPRPADVVSAEPDGDN